MTAHELLPPVRKTTLFGHPDQHHQERVQPAQYVFRRLGEVMGVLHVSKNSHERVTSIVVECEHVWVGYISFLFEDVNFNINQRIQHKLGRPITEPPALNAVLLDGATSTNPFPFTPG